MLKNKIISYRINYTDTHLIMNNCKDIASTAASAAASATAATIAAIAAANAANITSNNKLPIKYTENKLVLNKVCGGTRVYIKFNNGIIYWK